MKLLKKVLYLTTLIVFAMSIYAQENEIVGLVKKENINQKETLIFILDNNEKYEISGKLTSFIGSFYTNQKLKVLGKISKFSADEKKEKKLDGQIEIKEIIVTIQ
jgi:hypothetical protein